MAQDTNGVEIMGLIFLGVAEGDPKRSKGDPKRECSSSDRSFGRFRFISAYKPDFQIFITIFFFKYVLRSRDLNSFRLFVFLLLSIVPRDQ